MSGTFHHPDGMHHITLPSAGVDRVTKERAETGIEGCPHIIHISGSNGDVFFLLIFNVMQMPASFGVNSSSIQHGGQSR